MTCSACAAVTYRASTGDRDLAMQLAIDPDKATLADAWERLTAAFGPVDPRSIEIEIRPRPLLPARKLRRGGSSRIVPLRGPLQSLDAL